MITITTDGKRILAKFPYDRADVARVKTVPGARWNADGKEWRLPLTMDTCRSLRKVFGDRLEILPVLSAWARMEVERERQLELFREGELEAASELLRVKEEAPDLYAAMSNRDYQMTGAAFTVAGGQTILGDDPGLGKTLQALAAIIESDAHTILVACRRTATRTVWERETLRWAPDVIPYVAQGTRKEREAVMEQFRADVSEPGNVLRYMLIINIEMIRAKKIEICPQGLGADCPAAARGDCKHSYEASYEWPFLFDCEWGAIVLDESHNLLASTKNYQSKGITQGRFGAYKLRRQLRPGGLAIALSGTPFRSKLPKAWGTLNWLRPDVFGSFWRWAEEYFGVEQGAYGKVIGGGAKAPEPKDSEAWDRMLRPYYLRRTKAEAAPDLPPIQYAGTPIGEDPDSPCYVQIDMEPKQAKAYRQMADMAEASLENGRLMATGVLAEITRLRQFADAYGEMGDTRDRMLPRLPSNKLDWLVEFMQEREGSGRKVVVASSLTEMVDLAEGVLQAEGFQTLKITGATSDRDRASAVARFQDPHDEAQVFLINSAAGGESITLDAADEMVFLDMPWTSDEAVQVESRIHRVSRMHQVTVYRLASVGTVDTWIASLSDDQKRTLEAASPKAFREAVKEAVR